MLEHGGSLARAITRYGIAREDWLDLSTGINPVGWPVPPLPASVWSRLPETEDGLAEAARACYRCDAVLPVAGTQAAIQALPRLRAPGRVHVLSPGYAEHAQAWRRAGHEVAGVSADNLDGASSRADVLVVIHPNNPTGARFAPDRLLAWHGQLAARGGWLVVDEAFMDATNEASLAPHSTREGLVVLRSLGKFFGLAGARVGFVCAPRKLLARLEEALGPWTVATPARAIASAALGEREWQDRTRRRLIRDAARLGALLEKNGLAPDGGCALFQWVRTRDAARLHHRLAQRGLWVRLFAEPQSLRFGLPGAEKDWARLETALGELCRPALTGAAR